MSLFAALDALHRTPGGRAWRRIQVFRMTSRIVGLNGGELLEGIRDLSRAPLMPTLWDVNRRSQLREYHAELVRLLHNYLASVKTLVDHTRRMIQKDYRGHPLAAEYRSRLSVDISTSTLVAFVHDLRNYCLHVDLPPTRLTFTITSPGADSACEADLLLVLAPLREWREWSLLGRRHLSSLAEDPSLYSVLSSYHETVRTFNDWLLERLRLEHEAAIRVYLDAVNATVGRKAPEGAPGSV